MNTKPHTTQITTSLKQENIAFYDCREDCFRLYGVSYENGIFRRMPEAVAKNVSDMVYTHHAHTSGGRIKFITDSDFIAIHAKMPVIGKHPHYPMTGSSAFDLYVNNEYYRTFMPEVDMEGGYERLVSFGTKQKREIMIHFPLHSSVSELYIGLNQDAYIKKAKPYKYQKPIVYYGSSITQGACASRPGNSYENRIARALNTNFWSLGLDASAKAEDAIAQYIAGLDMSVFVFDYDHNAPDLAHLQATHQKMFKTIRSANPELPIVLLSRPKYTLTDEEKLRLETVKKTYTDAIESGDKNVYFIPGPELMQYAKNDGTVDNTHPNDLGFYSISKVLGKLLKTILKK